MERMFAMNVWKVIPLLMAAILTIMSGNSGSSKPQADTRPVATASASPNAHSSTIQSEPVKKQPEPLPVVGSSDNLVKLIKQAFGNNGAMLGYIRNGVMEVSDAKSDTSATAAETGMGGAATSGDFSQTNVQVQGVDEADIVKTDGSYIYQVNRERIAIVRTFPANKPELASFIRLDKALHPLELYVDGNHLIVIAQGQYDVGSMLSRSKRNIIMQPTRTVALTYDISQKKSPKLTRQVELEGSYLSSRKISSAVYLVSNRLLNIYAAVNDQLLPELPQYRDTAKSGGEPVTVPFSQIRYFPASPPNNYLTVAGFNLEQDGRPASVNTFLGGGNNVFASTENLYVACGIINYNHSPINEEQSDTMLIQHPDETTDVYRFSLEDGTTSYTGKGSVPGTILNQFSMDEYDGNFRIATTTGNVWESGASSSKNNVYVLDGSMNQSGKLEGLAPGEKIYSVRFMGNRAYVVTFRQVDPLFVLDLSTPSSPKVLGKLKIPGYSDYLHPYDETHLIGFGKDTEVASLDGNSDSGNTMAYYQGLKVAMFDVSDVEHPKELFKEIIGDRGTDSELLYDHKALLFNKDKNLMAFPVTLMKIPHSSSQVDDETNLQQVTAYGSFAFQGAYVYHVDLQTGFHLQGTITHLTQEEVDKAGDYEYENTAEIRRILYIGDQLYTLSDREIRANALKDLRQTGSLTIPE